MQTRSTATKSTATIRAEVIATIDGMAAFGDPDPSVAMMVVRAMRADGEVRFEVRRATDGKIVAVEPSDFDARSRAIDEVRGAILARDLDDANAEGEVLAALEALANVAGEMVRLVDDKAEACRLLRAVKAADAIVAKHAAPVDHRAAEPTFAHFADAD